MELYLISLNATDAYREAYGAKQSVAEANGARLIGNARVAKAIAEAQAKRSEKTGITAAAVLERYWAIVTADPRELVEYRRTCCRYCHGKDFAYQRTPAEMARDRAKWEAAQTKKSTEQFDEQGGIGYRGTNPPHPDCPECFGEGIEVPFFHDTRRVSPGAALLYAGVKVTKDGTEIKMHDQMAALTNVGKHLGMFNDRPPEAPDAAAVAAKVREALRAMLAADGLKAA